jgi:hypothetical protein
MRDPRGDFDVAGSLRIKEFKSSGLNQNVSIKKKKGIFKYKAVTIHVRKARRLKRVDVGVIISGRRERTSRIFKLL